MEQPEPQTKRRISFEEFEKRANKTHDNKYTYNSSTFKKMREKVEIYCAKHDETFQQTADNHVRGQQCPSCANESRVEKNISINLSKNNMSLQETLNEWLYEKNTVEPLETHKYSRDKVWWKCSVCQHEWQVSPFQRTYKKSGCPSCKTLKNGVEKYGSLEDTHAVEASEWSDLNLLKASDVHHKTKRKFSWECSTCLYTWESSPRTRAIDGKHCPLCAGRIVISGKNDLETNHSEILSEILSRIDPSKTHMGSSRKVKWKCKDCDHTWNATIRSRTVNKTGCPNCARKGSSNLEKILINLLEEYGVDFVVGRRPLRSDGKTFEIDVWIPVHGIGFEVQDYATHSKTSDTELLKDPYLTWSKQSNQSIYKKGPSYHSFKKFLAETQLNTKLYDIWEDELLSKTFENKVDKIFAEIENKG